MSNLPYKYKQLIQLIKLKKDIGNSLILNLIISLISKDSWHL